MPSTLRLQSIPHGSRGVIDDLDGDGTSDFSPRTASASLTDHSAKQNVDVASTDNVVMNSM